MSNTHMKAVVPAQGFKRFVAGDTVKTSDGENYVFTASGAGKFNNMLQELEKEPFLWGLLSDPAVERIKMLLEGRYDSVVFLMPSVILATMDVATVPFGTL